MGIFSSENPKEKEHHGILGSFSVDVIKWEPEDEAGASTIAHRFEYEDFPNGSILYVDRSQMAVFTNNVGTGSSAQLDGGGQAQVSVFLGPCEIKLDTGDSRFAPFRNVAHKLTDGASAFHSTVYFVNTTWMNELRWGTQAPVTVTDPEEEIIVHVRAHGMFGVHVDRDNTAMAPINARKFLEMVVGTRANFTRDDLVNFTRAKILEYVPDLLGKAMIEQNVGVLKLAAKYREFSDFVKTELVPHFESFGLSLDNFSFQQIAALDSDLAMIAEMKEKKRSARLQAEGNAIAMDIESEALARKREREGYSYAQEHAFDVMQTAAANEGTPSTFMGAGMGLGMGFGMGGAFGAGMNNLAQATMGAINQPAMTPAAPAAPAAAPAAGVKCSACGHMNLEGAKFCVECGQKIETGIPCPQCGKMAPMGAKFCMECGYKFNAATVCPNCGKELEPGAKFCVECGTRI